MWKYGDTTLKECKKALSLVPRLSPKMVQVDAVTKRVVGYASGINFVSFMNAINNGMYSMRDDIRGSLIVLMGHIWLSYHLYFCCIVHTR